MRQTLFYIPHELAGTPLFGLGWLLAVWTVVGLMMLVGVSVRRGVAEAIKLLPFLLAVAAAIAYLLPMLEVSQPGAPPLGLPIRGYGMMLLLAVVAGVAVAVHRGQQLGIEADHIYSLAFWLFVAGIAGARLFFVVQYWSTFPRDGTLSTFAAILDFTKGGLVVYGSLAGAALAFVAFTILKRVSPLQMADAIAPSLVLGLAIGRLGCLLNGCCYGGVCSDNQFGISFPRYSEPVRKTLSPAYHDQLSQRLTQGFVHGIRLSNDGTGIYVISAVKESSAAANAGVITGGAVKTINGETVRNINDASFLLGIADRQIDVATTDGQRWMWAAEALPEYSEAVHPTQLYSTINGLLIFGIAWTFFPFRRRVGEVCGIVLTVYPITRFLLEWVRVDEAGRFGTELTISQWVSLAILAAMLVYWPLVWRQPRIVGDRTGEQLV